MVKYFSINNSGEILRESKKDLVKLILKIAFILAILAAVIINYNRLVNIDIRALVASSSSETAAAAAITGIYALKGMVFVIPASLVYISVGMAFSPVKACIINMIGIAVEITVSYLFGLFVGGDYVENLLKKNKGGRKILELKEQNKQSSVILIRFLPVFPIDFTSLFFGSVKMNFPKYFLFSLLGLAPRVILFTLLGDRVYDLIPMPLLLKIIIAAIPVAAIAITIKWLLSRKKQSGRKEEE